VPDAITALFSSRVLSSDLLLKVNLPKVNALSQTNPNTELLAAQLIVR
jgi:hypothetical protein